MEIGVVGLGYWGPNLVRNGMENPRITEVHVYDMDKMRVKALKQRYAAVRVSDSFEAMISNSRIKAIAIATPVSTHYELAWAALNSGKHVIIEKPFTASVAEAEKLVTLAEKENLKILVDHTFIYTSAVQKIKTLVQDGSLGDIYYYDSVRVNLGLFQHDVNVIWDLAPHDFSIMDYLLEKQPVSVAAVGQAHIHHEGLENIAYVHLTFDNGLIAHFHLNWLSPMKLRRVLIGGSRKMLLFDDMETSDKVRIYDKGVNLVEKDDVHKALIQYRTGDSYLPQIRNVEALKEMMEHFVDCLETDTEPITDGKSGLRVMRMLEAAQQSLKLGGKGVPLFYD